jgi:hypothetical protein
VLFLEFFISGGSQVHNNIDNFSHTNKDINSLLQTLSSQDHGNWLLIFFHLFFSFSYKLQVSSPYTKNRLAVDDETYHFSMILFSLSIGDL